MLGALGSELVEALEQLGLETRCESRGSSGLSRPDFFDWPTIGAQAYREFRPHATVVNFGGNDAQGQRMPPGQEPPWVRWPEPAWPAEYGRRVVAFANAVAPRGEHLFWLGMPAMRSVGFDNRLRKINRIVRSSLAGRPGARFVSLRRVLSRGQQRYSDELLVDGVETRVREPDGVHINRGGGRYVARKVAPQIRDALQASPEPDPPLDGLLPLVSMPRAR
jgi:hypothetical protein